VFRKAGNSDIKVVAVVFLDVPNEVNPMGEASFHRLPDFFPGWRVSSKSQNVATSVLFSGLGQEKMFYFPSDDRR